MIIKTMSCRCGGGKTNSIQDDLLEKHQHFIGVTLLASKTIALSKQTYKAYQGRKVRLDSEITTSVSRDILTHVLEGFSGVIFVTHAALLELPNDLLNKVDVVIDEIPNSLVQYVSLDIDDGSVPAAFLNTWLSKESCDYKGYQSVSIKPEYINFVEQEVQFSKEGHSALKDEAIQVLKFLLEGYDVMYTTLMNKKRGLVHSYQAIQTSKLNKLSQSNNVTILAANVHNTLFSFVATNKMGFTFEDVTPNLEQKHKQRITIVPFLKAGNYSADFKKSIASEVISDSTSTKKAIDVFNEFVTAELVDDYVLFKNTRDTIPEGVATKNVKIMGTQVHGMNDLISYHKAAFTASLLPNPMEIKALQMFAKDNNLDGKEIINLVKTERSLEAAYQCVSRLSFRLATSNEHCKIVVPDMSYVEYIKGWFEEGCVTIDTTNSVISKSSSMKDDARDKRLQTVVSILVDKKNKVAPMPEILKAHKIHRNTYDNHKKEFKQQLQELGLVA